MWGGLSWIEVRVLGQCDIHVGPWKYNEICRLDGRMMRCVSNSRIFPTYDIAVGLISLYPHVVARRENMSELVQGCHAHMCNPLLPLFPLLSSSPSPLPHPPTLSSTCCPLLRLPEPCVPSWNSCGSMIPRTIPWER